MLNNSLVSLTSNPFSFNVENDRKCSKMLLKRTHISSFVCVAGEKLFDLYVLSLVHIGGFCPFGRGPCWQNEQGEIKRMCQCDLANNELSASQNVSFSTQNNTMNSRISPRPSVCTKQLRNPLPFQVWSCRDQTLVSSLQHDLDNNELHKTKV